MIFTSLCAPVPSCQSPTLVNKTHGRTELQFLGAYFDLA